MPFLMVEENARGKSIAHEYGGEGPKQAGLFLGIGSMLLTPGDARYIPITSV